MLTKAEKKLHIFLNSRMSFAVYTLLACFAMAFSLMHYAIPLFVLWMVFTVILEKNFLNVFLPLVLVCGMELPVLGQTVVNQRHFWLAVPIVLAIALHLFIHYKRFRGGRMLLPQIAVAVALVCGGIFFISAEQYFRIESVYYVLFLGVGMVLLYIWFRSSVSSNEHYDCRERLMESFYALGIFCAFSILCQALRMYLAMGVVFQSYSWANDIGDMMLFAIPAAFYFARKSYIHVLVGAVFYGLIFLTSSLSAIAVGGVLFAACFVYLAVVRPSHRRLTLLLLGLVTVGGVLLGWYALHRAGGFSAFLATESSGRLDLIAGAWRQFLSAPVFGVGIGTPNDTAQLYMTVDWTHNFIFQVLGSMGLVGLLAYGYQLYGRARLIFAKRNAFHGAVGLIYFGLLAISMFQPGEFCPMPYALMSMMLFVVLETSDEEAEKKSKIDEKKRDAS